MRAQLGSEILLEEVFKILDNPELWTDKYKQRNLINAFAKSYDQLLYKGATIGDIASVPNGNIKPHLEKICFNTTEFNNGLNFYFKADADGTRKNHSGNNYLRFKNGPEVRSLKISDVVAASSCFPAGFEPVISPNDFVHASYPNG